MDKNKKSASFAGTASRGGELSVHRLGFGAMRLTGEGIWALHEIGRERSRFWVVRSS